MDKTSTTFETDINSAESNQNKQNNRKKSIATESDDENSGDSKRFNISLSSNNLVKKDKLNQQGKENIIDKTVTGNNSNEEKTTNSEFKLRIVPLEKLLERPKLVKKQNQSDTQLKPKSAPQAIQSTRESSQRVKRINYSIIDISSSSSEEEETVDLTNKSISPLQKQKFVSKAKETQKDIDTTTTASTPTIVTTVTSSIEHNNILLTETTSTETSATAIAATSTEETTVEILKVKKCVIRLKRLKPSTIKAIIKRKKMERTLRVAKTSKYTTQKTSSSSSGSGSTNQADGVDSPNSEYEVVTLQDSNDSDVQKLLDAQLMDDDDNDDDDDSNANGGEANGQKPQDNGEDEDDDEDEDDANSSDSEVMPVPKNRTKAESTSISTKRGSKKERDGDTSDSDEFEAFENSNGGKSDDSLDSLKGRSKRKQRGKTKANDDDGEASEKSSGSEIMPVPKKRVFNKRKRSTSSNDFDLETIDKPAKKRTGRMRKPASDDSGDDDDEKNKNKRKHIRKIIKSSDLDISTKNATKEEEERRKRIEERQKLYNQIYDKPENVEVSELILDFDEETKEPLLEVDKGLLRKLKPHQVSGVKFMWDACFETLQDVQEKPGSGCILAHCMGLGKTLQVVTLSHTLIANARKTGVERVLIISPLSTLNNWAREFAQWMSFTRKRNIEVYDMSKHRDKPTRIFKLNEWFEEGGVCVLGYDMYRILANEKAKGLRKKQRETLQKALVEPGPDLVVCDEGHLLKNEKTSISKAVTRMRTKRRIVLTGTPLQNNLKEYYCMIQFIKPNLLGTYKEYLNRFVNPITNGQYTDSTDRDLRLMKHRSHILHKLLEGCIQRRDYSVLAPYLPPKHEYVVYTTVSLQQELLYEYYMTTQRDLTSSDITGKGARLFQDFQDLRRIWTHPLCLRINSDIVIRKRLLMDDADSMEDFIDDDDDDGSEDSASDGGSISSSKSFASGNGRNNRGGRVIKTRNKTATDDNDDEIDDEMSEQPAEKDDPSEWWKRFVADQELNNIHNSPKLVILMKLLEQCEAIGDKLLVFSQSLQSLDVIEHFLSLIDSRTRGEDIDGDVGDFKGYWKPGKDYFRLDGSCSVEQREAMCKKFNDPLNLSSRLFLISTRAGGLGINLVAANRVVIFDVSWNPSHDTQSIFRVYRFGQVKPCYIYRLIAMGTMEQKVYERQVAKQATAKRVIDEQQISRHYNQSDLQELYTYELKPSTEREIPKLPKDRLFAELLSEHDKLIFKYHEHDSLLENEDSENLTEDERKAAWSEYEAEKTRSVQTSQYMSYDRGAYGGVYGNASGSITSNKIFGFRSDVLLQLLNMKVAKDQPELNQNQVIQLVPTYLQQLYTEMNNGDPTMYKDLLALNETLARPSGMYMNPLLYVNQNPSAAGYYQAPSVQQPQAPQQPLLGIPMPPLQSVGPPSMVARPTTAGAPAAAASSKTGGFEPDKVYEID